MGLTGKGIIVTSIDTGVYKDHEALKDNFAGGWFDADNGKEEPYDDKGHGTLTMGLICGRSGSGTWIACKASAKNGLGSEEYFLTCAGFDHYPIS